MFFIFLLKYFSILIYTFCLLKYYLLCLEIEEFNLGVSVAQLRLITSVVRNILCNLLVSKNVPKPTSALALLAISAEQHKPIGTRARRMA